MTSQRQLTSVPFLDISRVTDPVKDDVLDDVRSLLESGAFTNGPQVGEFETAFARFCNTQHCVGVANGLDALRLGLTAAGLEPGQEVIVPAMTFIATFEAVTQAGGVPVPADISESDYCLDPAAARAAVRDRTAALLPVHLYGRMADMRAIGDLASVAGLFVFEDACQAHGARRDGLGAGSVGKASAFSFYPGKNLGAIGDAGALTTDDADLAAAVRALREHGQGRKYHHDRIGWTARLDTIQAAVLLRKLPLLERWNEARRAAADLYATALAEVGDLVLPDTSDRGQVWHLYVIQTADPIGLAAHLAERGVATGRHYPEPPHLSEAYRDLGHRADSFPVAERLSRQALSLPMYPGMTDSEVELVADGVKAWFSGD